MSLEELDALIIRNVANIDTARKRLDNEISAEIASAIDDAVSKWATEQNWTGSFYWPDDLWFAPWDWGIPGAGEEDSDWFGYFRFHTLEAENKDSSWLACLCGGKLGFQWIWSIGLRMNKPQWKKFTQTVPDIFEKNTQKPFCLSGRLGIFRLPRQN